MHSNNCGLFLTSVLFCRTNTEPTTGVQTKMHCFKSDTDQSVLHTYSFLQFCLVMLVVQKLPHLYDFQEVMISTKNGNDRSGEETRRRGVREEEEEEEEEESSIKRRRHERRGAQSKFLDMDYIYIPVSWERTVEMDYGECDAGYTLYSCPVRTVLYIQQSEMSSCLKQGLWLDIVFFLE